MHLEPKQPRITRTYTIEPHLYEQVKQCANKDARVVSRIIENYLTRYEHSLVMNNKNIIKINQLLKDAKREQSSTKRQEMIIQILELMMQIQ